MASSSSAAPAPQTVRPTNPEDWEPYKDVISHLYTEVKLKDVMREMERSYGFKATEKQYKTQIKKWCLDTKYVKSSEYLAMIKWKRRRERENPPKETRFTLRGRLIDPRDIVRFEKRAIKKGLITPGGNLSGQESIEDLGYETPSPSGATYS
ncbi:Clr5 domain-containing protein [Coniochaeta sp. 2T2.1]|nr:Clr5 domain-containing protein [Coniochaeta sp. 2T2.1]